MQLVVQCSVTEDITLFHLLLQAMVTVCTSDKLRLSSPLEEILWRPYLRTTCITIVQTVDMQTLVCMIHVYLTPATSTRQAYCSQTVMWQISLNLPLKIVIINTVLPKIYEGKSYCANIRLISTINVISSHTGPSTVLHKCSIVSWNP